MQPSCRQIQDVSYRLSETINLQKQCKGKKVRSQYEREGGREGVGEEGAGGEGGGTQVCLGTNNAKP